MSSLVPRCLHAHERPEELAMPAVHPRKIFVNLPVKSIEVSVGFFTRLRFEFNAQFTDEKATCMVLSDDAYDILLAEDFFRTFTSKDLCDPNTQVEAIFALSAESREEVAELVNRALAAGAHPANDPQDHGFMYGWSFQDLDGHLWEIIWMDPGAVHE
jgi:predicted lactoylglutathione lyase